MEKKKLRIDIIPKSTFMPTVQKISEAIMLEAGAGDINQDTQTYNFVLAVDEIIANIIKHGVRLTRKPFMVTIKYSIGPETVKAVICDGGVRYSPPGEYDEKIVLKNYSGMGLHFVRSLMDVYQYRYDSKNKKNIVTLAVNLNHALDSVSSSA
ncbi:MAG: ATP-binding protein [bacterium]|nr:ATP-binding protein [bacterium]